MRNYFCHSLHLNQMIWSVEADVQFLFFFLFSFFFYKWLDITMRNYLLHLICWSWRTISGGAKLFCWTPTTQYRCKWKQKISNKSCNLPTKVQIWETAQYRCKWRQKWKKVNPLQSCIISFYLRNITIWKQRWKSWEKFDHHNLTT